MIFFCLFCFLNIGMVPECEACFLSHGVAGREQTCLHYSEVLEEVHWVHCQRSAPQMGPMAGYYTLFFHLLVRIGYCNPFYSSQFYHIMKP